MKYKHDIETQIRQRLEAYGDMLRIQDVADILGCVNECARRRIADGHIRSVMAGPTCYVAKEWLLDYLDAGFSIRERDRNFQTKRDKIVEFCKQPRSRIEIQEHFGYRNKEYMRKVLTILIGQGRLGYTERPHHWNQKFVALRESV